MIFEILENFLSQAEIDDLRTSHYQKKYKEFRIKVSFGQGNKSKIPWIAILRNGQKVSKGIYPVYLYYRQQKKLLLCFGISESSEPESSWGDKIQKDYPKISENITDPPRYRNSFVFKEYQIENGNLNFPKSKIESDFLEILEMYRANKFIEVKNISGKVTSKEASNLLSKLLLDLKNSSLVVNKNLTLRFVSSLCTKPFLILTGLSGSGKTKLAHAFAQWICDDSFQFCMIPVGADWTNREPLLGYPNALESQRYVKPDNGVIELILEAMKPENENKPYFLILDEMNLSHVERYFADFLSAMESDESIPLHPETNELWDNIPAEIRLPDNLFVIGTVNIDETTYMFSPKVLDRANVIEFRVTEDELKEFLENPIKPNLELLKGNGSGMAADFVDIAKGIAPEFSEKANLNGILTEFFNELKKVGAEYGYRTVFEIYRFAAIISYLTEREGSKWAVNDIADSAVIQKLLPKLHGSRRKLEPVLEVLAGLCLSDKADAKNYLNPREKPDLSNREKVRFPLSLDKIIRMYNRALQDGFTSFAEA